MAKNNRNVSSRSSGGQESSGTGLESRSQQGDVFSRGPRGESAPFVFRLPAAAGLPWLVALVAVSLLSLPAWVLGALLSPLCVSHLPLTRTLVVVFRAHPGNPGSSPHLEDPVTPVNLVIAAKALSTRFLHHKIVKVFHKMVLRFKQVNPLKVL